MRTPYDEAHRIVASLAQQMLTMPEKLRQWPDVFFSEMSSADNLALRAKEVEMSISTNADLTGTQREFVLELFRSCAHAANACRLPLAMGWPEVVDAQRYAGAALSRLVSSAEAKWVGKERARHAKREQAKKNDPIRFYVLDAAAGSTLETPSGAAANIVGKLEAKHGSLVVAMQKLGSDLTPEAGSLTRLFAGYITKDMERLGLRSPGIKVPQPLNRELFSRWKKLYVSPADG